MSFSSLITRSIHSLITIPVGKISNRWRYSYQSNLPPLATHPFAFYNQNMSLHTASTDLNKLVFTSPPNNFKPKFYIAAVFCECDGKFLFLLRQHDKSCGNTWGIPGGKLEKGETPMQGALRELVEETNLKFNENCVEDLGRVYIRYETHDFNYHMFRKRLTTFPKDLKINKIEHQKARWLTLKQAIELPLIPGELECIQHIYGPKLEE